MSGWNSWNRDAFGLTQLAGHVGCDPSRRVQPPGQPTGWCFLGGCCTPTQSSTFHPGGTTIYGNNNNNNADGSGGCIGVRCKKIPWPVSIYTVEFHRRGVLRVTATADRFTTTTTTGFYESSRCEVCAIESVDTGRSDTTSTVGDVIGTTTRWTQRHIFFFSKSFFSNFADDDDDDKMWQTSLSRTLLSRSCVLAKTTPAIGGRMPSVCYFSDAATEKLRGIMEEYRKAK